MQDFIFWLIKEFGTSTLGKMKPLYDRGSSEASITAGCFGVLIRTRLMFYQFPAFSYWGRPCALYPAVPRPETRL